MHRAGPGYLRFQRPTGRGVRPDRVIVDVEAGLALYVDGGDAATAIDRPAAWLRRTSRRPHSRPFPCLLLVSLWAFSFLSSCWAFW